MKQLKPRFRRLTTFNTVAVILVAAIPSLGVGQAVAQNSPTNPAAPTSPPAPTSPVVVPDDAELQVRLNNLDQRLDKVGAVDIDPISLLLPNISSNVPNAYGASQGMVAVGAGYQNRTRFSGGKADGAVSAVVGLGDPRKLGVDVQGSFLDLSRFGHRLSLGFKLHRQLANDLTVAVGGENVLVSSYSDSGASYYAVISKKLRLKESSREPFSRVYLSAGVGNGRFLSEGDLFNDNGGINVFGSAAINISRSSTAFAEWTGQSLNVGASIVPFRKYPFAVTVAAADIAGNGGDGSRFTIGVGYVFAR